MEVVPGERLGCFQLGMGVNDALVLLKKYFVPKRPKVDVVYSSKMPLEQDIVLKVEELGLHLRFEPVSQRLRMIDVFDLTKLSISYSGSTVGSKTSPRPSFLQLYKIFGPTYPGEYDEALDMYLLRYRGICFMFSLPDDLKAVYAKTNELPLELRDGTSPLAGRMMVYNGFDERHATLVDAVVDEPVKLNGIQLTTLASSYLEQVCFKISETGTTLQFLRRHRNLRIGSSVQDVLSELGQPSRIYFKHDNRMKIHAAGEDPSAKPAPTWFHSSPEFLSSIPLVSRISQKDPSSCFQPSDYFYNYFELGLDLLLDAATHTIKKVIAHSNFPGHSEFSLYNKCEFRVVFSAPDDKGEPVIISPEMKWADVEALLGPCGRPMIHDSGIVANPFGATHLYAYNGCVFEVMRSGYVAKVTVF
mmetsp:Transcript_28431/g.45774  ORF Transcript_28431/g.45774 Transcript_28431/m.45774 type:complete len:417 (-) Transcript_28431:1884-3134(-)